MAKNEKNKDSTFWKRLLDLLPEDLEEELIEYLQETTQKDELLPPEPDPVPVKKQSH